MTEAGILTSNLMASSRKRPALNVHVALSASPSLVQIASAMYENMRSLTAVAIASASDPYTSNYALRASVMHRKVGLGGVANRELVSDIDPRGACG